MSVATQVGKMATSNMTHQPTEVNQVSLEERRHIVEGKLNKRDDERLANVEKRREEKSQTSSKEESVKFFMESFAKERSILEHELSKCESLDKSKLVDAFDSVSAMHQKLQRYLTESTMFLPSYDVRQAQENLVELQNKIQEKRDELIPKKKFAFKSKKKGNVSGKTEDPKPTVSTSAVDNAVALADCKVTDQQNQTIEMKSDINLKDVALTDLDNCTVKLLGAPSAIHINKLNNCKIFSGPVSGSIFIRECRNCTFVVPCQQLRIHTTKDTQFYIHVTSKAIIEDCSTVSFAPYNWKYPDIDDNYKISGLDRSKNNWDDVDDFNWLAADKHSPNWSVIPESDRIIQWE